MSAPPAGSIRIALSTSAAVVRLTSSRPFRVGSGATWLETHDVLVERELSARVESSRVHRVELGSFPTEAAAGAFRARLTEELVIPLSVVRETRTGRFAVRGPSFTTESGARVEGERLEGLGFEGTRVVSEPLAAAQPTALTLLAAGIPPVRLAPIPIVAVPSAPGAWVEVEGDPYRGYVEIAVNVSGAFTVTNVVQLEDYLQGVVPAELSPEVFPEKEALKAQAVAARTYALKHRGQFAAEGYDLCATAACQVYRGVSAERLLSNEAVAETEGEVLTFGGELVDALYTSTCGGRTESAGNVFAAEQPYLVSRACLLERRPPVVSSSNGGPLSLEAAALFRLGIVEPGSGVGPTSFGEAKRWMDAALRFVGQSPCWSPGHDEGATVDLFELAGLLGEALCWERRLPFLLSPLEAERIVGPGAPEPQLVQLAYALRDGLIVPEETGIRPGVPVSRRDVVRTLYQLLQQRAEPVLQEARVRSADAERLVLVDDGAENGPREIAMPLAPTRYLFKSLASSVAYAARLALLPNDRVRFHAGEDGIDLLVLLSDGASFDRSSRFSHWVVRKSADELTRDVGSRHAVGDVRELRPKRYGPSGRIVELEVVGSGGTVELKGLAIRRALGLRENLFFFDVQRDADGAVIGWVFTGRGWGHGVGLCQVGAYGMAAAGFGFREILSHYYPGTAVQEGRAARVGDIDKEPGPP